MFCPIGFSLMIFMISWFCVTKPKQISKTLKMSKVGKLNPPPIIKHQKLQPNPIHEVPSMSYEVPIIFHEVHTMCHDISIMFHEVEIMFHGIIILFH